MSSGEDGEEEAVECSGGAVPGNLFGEMGKKVDTERGRGIYPQRIGIAEPVFANIRAVKGVDRFTLRGKIKVNIQWVLYCMVHNIGKIVSYGFAGKGKKGINLSGSGKICVGTKKQASFYARKF